MKSSILITCYNRSLLLNNSLPSLLKQSPDEIIIVDDGSTDRLSGMIETWKRQAKNTEIKYFYRNHPGYNNSAVPKNIALKQSIGDIIIVSDPEVIHYTPAVQQMLKHLTDNNDAYTVASTMYFVTEARQPFIQAAVRNDTLDLFVQDADRYHVGYYSGDKVYYMENQEAPFIGGFRREHLMRIGGWDERFDEFWGHEDTDLISRLMFSGVRRIMDNNIKGIHQFHSRPPIHAVSGVDQVNLPIVQSRSGTNFIANQGRAWGIL